MADVSNGYVTLKIDFCGTISKISTAVKAYALGLIKTKLHELLFRESST